MSNKLEFEFDNGDFKLDESSRSVLRPVYDKAVKKIEVALKKYLIKKGYADEVEAMRKYHTVNPNLKFNASNEILDEMDKFFSYYDNYGIFLK